MIELIKTLLNSVDGQQVSAVFALTVIIAIVFMFGFFMYKIINFILKNPDFLKKKLNGSNELSTEEDEKRIIRIVGNEMKINEDLIIEKIAKKIENQTQIKIYEQTKSIYEKISEMREQYANAFVSREEVREIREDIQSTKIELANLKGRLDI